MKRFTQKEIQAIKQMVKGKRKRKSWSFTFTATDHLSDAIWELHSAFADMGKAFDDSKVKIHSYPWPTIVHPNKTK